MLGYGRQKFIMRIPKRFKLLGHTIEVVESPGDHFNERRFGSTSYEGKEIRIVPRGSNHPVTQSSIEHTFLHELVHLCLYHTEQSKLNENDSFVDAFAGLLHQALTTMEYEKSSGKTGGGKGFIRPYGYKEHSKVCVKGG